MFKPLKITFHLVAPTIPADSGFDHLDGLVAFAVVQDALLNDPNARSKGFKELHSGVASLLDMESRDGESVYKASGIRLSCEHPSNNGGMAMMLRTTDVDGIAAAKGNYDRYSHELKNKDFHADGAMLATLRKNGEFQPLRTNMINTASGELRNFQLFFPTVMARRGVAYCIGDPERLSALLRQHIKYIGRKGAAGYGAVKQIDVEEDADAHTRWQERNMPWPIDGYVSTGGNTSSPYWEASTKKIVWVPADM